MSLNEALSDLVTKITSSGYDGTLVVSVADTWAVNPILLSRKFQETYLVEAADYKRADKDGMYQLKLARVRALAKAEREYMTLAPDTPDICGIVFVWNGIEMVAVATTDTGIMAIDLEDEKYWQLWRRALLLECGDDLWPD